MQLLDDIALWAFFGDILLGFYLFAYYLGKWRERQLQLRQQR